MKARGIWATLLSKPDDWQVYVSQLVKTSKDGKASIYSGLKELKNAGYIEHVFIRDDAGRMIRGEYIVYEDPIEIKKTPATLTDKPYTENRNTDNPPLLKTDGKIKTNDDNVPPPQKPNTSPEPSEPEQTKEKDSSSSSFSNAELITVIAGLMALIPEQHQKPIIKTVIEKALKVHSEAYIKSGIEYTNTHSNGGKTAKYKAYLAKCIDEYWHDGWEPEGSTFQEDLIAIKKQFMKMKNENLKSLADAGNQFAIDEIKRRE